jgi:predicted nuclease of predicted toxin-antitoxin system
LARWITSNGHVAAHVSDVGLTSASDAEIWQYAIQNSYVVITKDEDFAVRVTREPVIQLLWIRRGNCSTKALLNWFGPLFASAVSALQDGETLVEMS